jgi:hypothetical protein
MLVVRESPLRLEESGIAFDKPVVEVYSVIAGDLRRQFCSEGGMEP